MFRLRHIEKFDAPELAPYRTMRRPKEHHVLGIFVAEGDKVVERLLRDPSRRVALRAQGALVAEARSWDAIWDGLLREYLDVIGGPYLRAA